MTDQSPSLIELDSSEVSTLLNEILCMQDDISHSRTSLEDCITALELVGSVLEHSTYSISTINSAIDAARIALH